MKFIGWLHHCFVYSRRVKLLASRIEGFLPKGAKILDVGCGDGLIDYLIMKTRPDVSISGIDVIVPVKTHIPVRSYNGRRIPYDDRSFDAVLFIDVLHHTTDPLVLLREAMRVSKGLIILKDHIQSGLLDRWILKAMDLFGNIHKNISLPYNYWTENQWQEAFSNLGLTVENWESRMGLYPKPATYIFDRKLHFVATVNTNEICSKA